jgi:HEPN domain-containing protein
MKMQLQILFLTFITLLAGCTKSGRDTTAGDPVEDESNQALYEKVMDIHDAVMPKMNDLYKLKKKLQDKLNSDLPEDKQKEIESLLAQIEAASEGMMVWMREFNPPGDEVSEEELREYLEGQMEKIKTVSDAIIEVLEKGKGEF